MAVVRLAERTDGRGAAAPKEVRIACSDEKEGFNEEWELRREGRTDAGPFSAFPGRASWSRLFPLFSVFRKGEATVPPKNVNMQKITALCEKTAAQMHYELCDAAIEKEPTGRYLRIYIDKEGGITLDDCEAFHRAVQPKLEDFDYDFLEVCSPGIDRPLKTKRDVEKSLGLLVEAKLYKALDGQKAVQGLLQGMDDEKVTLTVGENTVELPRKAVSQVRLVPDLSALDEE